MHMHRDLCCRKTTVQVGNPYVSKGWSGSRGPKTHRSLRNGWGAFVCPGPVECSLRPSIRCTRHAAHVIGDAMSGVVVVVSARRSCPHGVTRGA